MTTQSSNKIQEFRNAGYAMSLAIAPVVENTVSETLTNMFEISAGGKGDNRELQLKGGGVESVSGTSGSTFTASIFDALRAKEKERREATSSLITFLSMLEDIDRQIAAIDHQIGEYEAELGELVQELSAMEELRELVESDLLDPTNPDHIRLLKQSGIPEDQWGVITPTMLDDHIKDTKTRIEDLEEKIRKAKDTRTKLEDKRDDIYDKMEDNPESRADPETIAIAVDARESFYSIERELSESEGEWFIRCVSNAPQSDWDKLIDQLSDRGMSDLKRNDQVPVEVRDYMRVSSFEAQFEEMCTDVPAEEHHYVLMDMLENLEAADSEALLRSDNTPEYIEVAMSEIGISKQGLTQGLHLGIDQ